MCQNIRTLFNFDPPATQGEITSASLQFVRKLSGFNSPSKINEDVFNLAVKKISSDAQQLIGSLRTQAIPRNREVEAERARAKVAKRFGIK